MKLSQLCVCGHKRSHHAKSDGSGACCVEVGLDGCACRAFRAKPKRRKDEHDTSDYEALANAIMHPKPRIQFPIQVTSTQVSVALLSWLVKHCTQLSRETGRDRFMNFVPPALRDEYRDILRTLKAIKRANIKQRP